MAVDVFEQHDHSHCIQDAMKAAEEHCAAKKLQFTPVRRRVLEILLQEHRAMGAYDILSILAEEGLGKQPPVVYRALDFLRANGFVHKVERVNGYVACTHPGATHAPAFMICRDCNRVAETHSNPGVGLRDAAEDIGFSIEATVIEVEGLCSDCKPPQ